MDIRSQQRSHRRPPCFGIQEEIAVIFLTGLAAFTKRAPEATKLLKIKKELCVALSGGFGFFFDHFNEFTVAGHQRGIYHGRKQHDSWRGLRVSSKGGNTKWTFQYLVNRARDMSSIAQCSPKIIHGGDGVQTSNKSSGTEARRR